MAAYNRRSPLQQYNNTQLPQITGSTTSYPSYQSDTPSTQYQTPQQSTPSTLEQGQFPQPGQLSVFPRVTACSPSEGAQGTDFTIVVTSTTDLTKDARSFRALFGSKRCAVNIQKSTSIDGLMSFTLTTKVPPNSLTGWYNQKVPVYFNIEDEHGNELNTEFITDFTYTDFSPPQSYESSPNPDVTARKRRLSGGVKDITASVDAYRSQVKRPALQPDIRPKGEDYIAYSYPSVSGSSFPSYAQTASDRSVFGYGEQGSDRTGTNAGAWNGLYPSAFTPAMLRQLTRMYTVPSASSDPVGGNPTLVRTSTLQQSHGSFNPYQLPQKANLALQGDLNSMAENWTQEEWQNKRRLVQFRRTQRGNTVEASFAPVSPSERQANSICISCIWWQERGETFVTSVDCIYLLEALVGVRFTVEEKNRIRRNLEGFHPLTKDVKVFPWKILTLALKKIIGKYSASYSSTASVMTPPIGSSAPMMPNASPRSDSTSPSVPQRATASVSPPAAAHAYPQQAERPAVTSGHMPQGMTMGAPAPANSWAQLPHLQPPQHIPRTSWDGMGRQGLEMPPVYPENIQNVSQPGMHSMSYQRLPNPYSGNVDSNQQIPRHNNYSMS
ncbi:hypothetical protein ABW19_dt0200036 [Dactylella cylindrospora]|nr:hypothetical protein ABW19_dt0200036 [Dactylella cylindrospora]